MPRHPSLQAACGLLALTLAAPVPRALAQHDHGTGAAPARSPYTALQQREIKALSDSQVQQYLSGEGIGFALAAELNHYPGPRHALDMAAPLGLTEAQARTLRTARESMVVEARRLGEGIVAAERELDRAFASGGLSEPRLRELTASIARLQGELRFAHLRAHLETRAALTPEQLRRYDELRGYAGSGGDGEHNH